VEGVMLQFGRRYKVTNQSVIASQFNESRTELVAEEDDHRIPKDTIILVLDSFHWDPYSQTFGQHSLNPNFYYIQLEGSVPGFVSRRVAAQAHVLEQSVEEISE